MKTKRSQGSPFPPRRGQKNTAYRRTQSKIPIMRQSTLDMGAELSALILAQMVPSRLAALNASG